MKAFNTFFLILTIGIGQHAFGAEVIQETDDNTAGTVFGGATGLLIGGAISGGPLGAIVGVAVGGFSGKFAQSNTGLSQRAYYVKAEDEQVEKVRSPNQIFQPGDAVTISGNRLHSTR